ncbi:HsdM family class I SAM-dependent methyltransferase [Sediminibacillus albus]|uniref:site-specific DNA-methyltransferase (adenine-specific) n=1 Tax=Sediminibacillus albus TaxID=407036 RepID=A0A1G8ZQL2_9BACI|nr:N-6 DNA methylase [Sediminibacillus albus]SDK17341.1 adenine-specific DNA-methyltransferase [Sediminibacillus albus]
MENIEEMTEKYYHQVPASARKQLGQYFTPPAIARPMKTWVTGKQNCTKLLDPAVGLGELAVEIPENISVTGYDIDKNILAFAKQRLAMQPNPFHLLEQDFLTSEWDDKYEGIICNPPYIKFKNYQQKTFYLQQFKSKLGITLSGFTNMYALFLLKALHQLSENGRAAFIIPSDFLNADYGTPIKKYLIQQQSLHAIAVTDFKVNWFQLATTTSALFFFDKSHSASQIEFIHIDTNQELLDLDNHLKNYYSNPPIGKIKKNEELLPAQKWRAYYQPEREHTYHHLKPIDQFAQVTRGIATGDNKFFCISETKRKHWKLDKKYFVPCLSKGGQVNGSFFTEDNYHALLANDLPVQLLDVNEEDLTNEKLAAYIKYGEESGSSDRYLTKRRRPWFKNESRLPADILISTFSRNKVKFIRNEAGARNLTAFHCLYMRPEYEERVDILMAYLMTDISQQLFESRHREYGKGLKKLEPNDIRFASVIDLDVVSTEESAQISAIYQKAREKQLSSPANDYSTEIRQLNNIFQSILSYPTINKSCATDV